MVLKHKVELLHRSSQRMMDMVPVVKTGMWWAFMRRESWIHIKRTIEVLWHVAIRRE